ncbi:MAG TPA: glycosyltransferase family 2 protein, partial [Bryobacteraceae bacterium]|nr:glycosyltransferase family 2 protein [Bryobacteraceae bacterium]
WSASGVLSIGVALLVTISSLAKWMILRRMRSPDPVQPPEGLRVAAVTTYVAHSEPIEMIEITLQAMCAMAYPHDTWLLDETDDEAARKLCRKLGVRHFSRKYRPEYHGDGGTFGSRTKHGNYNAWLTDYGFDHYDVVAAFDPDHIPRPEYLIQTIGYFCDGRIGYVQAPQVYYNQAASFIAAGAAEETYDFNSTIQMAAFGMGYPIVMGCHNVHRVTALEAVGGFAAHDADDLLITMHYREAGWSGVYVPLVLAKGVTPVDWPGYLTQQRRWARSLLDLKLRRGGANGVNLPLKTRIASGLHGVNYLQPLLLAAMSYVLVLEIALRGSLPVTLASLPKVPLLAVAALLTICYLFRQRYFLQPDVEAGVHCRARLLRLAKVPQLALAFSDVMFGRQFGYVMTPKSATNDGNVRGNPLLGFAAAGTTVAAAWLYSASTLASYTMEAHLVSSAVVSFCGSLFSTQFLRRPKPFDARLAKRAHEG